MIHFRVTFYDGNMIDILYPLDTPMSLIQDDCQDCASLEIIKVTLA